MECWCSWTWHDFAKFCSVRWFYFAVSMNARNDGQQGFSADLHASYQTNLIAVKILRKNDCVNCHSRCGRPAKIRTHIQANDVHLYVSKMLQKKVHWTRWPYKLPSLKIPKRIRRSRTPTNTSTRVGMTVDAMHGIISSCTRYRSTQKLWQIQCAQMRHVFSTECHVKYPVIGNEKF